MELVNLNPFLRFMDRRICRYSYKTPICACDARLFYLLEGEARLLLENQTLILKAGDGVFFPGGLPYQFFFDEETPAEMFVLNFDPDCTRTALRPQTPGPAEAFREQQPSCLSFPPPLDRPVSVFQAQSLEAPLARLLSEHEGRSPYRQALCSALLKAIVVQLLRLKEGPLTELQEPVRSLAAYLNAHYCEPLTGKMLSERFNYHAYYLGRCFREQMGVSIHQYVLSLRLKKCARLLISSPLSIAEIAAECGFSSSSYLAEYFKKVYRLSPGQYREAGRLA